MDIAGELKRFPQLLRFHKLPLNLYILRYVMNIETMETRDCLQCGHTDSPCGGHVYESLVEFSCNETITTTLQFNIDGKDLEEIKVETMTTLPIKGYPECVCWRQEMGTRTFRRPHDLVGFSTDTEMTMPGK
jgi:hypothetical protein